MDLLPREIISLILENKDSAFTCSLVCKRLREIIRGLFYIHADEDEIIIIGEYNQYSYAEYADNLWTANWTSYTQLEELVEWQPDDPAYCQDCSGFVCTIPHFIINLNMVHINKVHIFKYRGKIKLFDPEFTADFIQIRAVLDGIWRVSGAFITFTGVIPANSDYIVLDKSGEILDNVADIRGKCLVMLEGI